MTNEVIFPSRCRWRLEAKSFPELTTYTVSVQHDYFVKSIALTVLDAIVNGKPIIHDWIVKSLGGEETLYIHHYDDKGSFLYKKVLKGAKLVGHKCNHDYEDNCLQDHEVLFTYEELQTVDNFN